MANNDTPSSKKRSDIQGLRALAVLLVIAYHAGLPVRGGFIGVDVFFVISGYVITQLLLRELQSTGRINFPRFYLRRFKRLAPALGLVVSVSAIAASFLLAPLGEQQAVAKTALESVAMVANFAIASASGNYFAPAEIGRAHV